MNKLICIVIFFIPFVNSYGQHQSDSIEIRKQLVTVFRQDGENLTPRELLEITQSNTEAYKKMKIAKSNYDIGYVLGGVGGFLVGWPIGSALAGGDPNWVMAEIGAGLVVVSIPFFIAYKRHAKNAARLYNSGLRQTGFNSIDFKFRLAHNGVGLKITF